MISKINNILLTNEKILWHKMPNKKLFTSADLFIVPLTMAFCLPLMIGIVYIFLLTPLDYYFKLIGLPLFLIYFYYTFGRFIIKIYIKSKTHYLITNQRIIIVKDFKTLKVNTKHINSINNLAYKEKRNGKSSIFFETPHFLTPVFANSGMEFFMSSKSPYGQLPMAFYDIDDAKEVYDIVDGILTKQVENA